jgi:two-component system LytT family response regulator
VSAPLRVLVVDDEPLARSGIADLARKDPELEVVGECGDGIAALDAIQRMTPDLVVLDVQMPELNGFEVLQHLPQDRLPAVVFVTAYDSFAVRAFDVHAIDYLVKPFDDARFVLAMRRAKAAIRGPALPDLHRRLAEMLAKLPPGVGATERYLSRIVIRNGGRTILVRTTDIDWIEAADYCVKLHVHGKVHLLRESMAALTDRLDPANFFRVHRSAIVNLERILELQPMFKGEHVVLLQDGTRLKLSKGRRGDLEARLGQAI